MSVVLSNPSFVLSASLDQLSIRSSAQFRTGHAARIKSRHRGQQLFFTTPPKCKLASRFFCKATVVGNQFSFLDELLKSEDLGRWQAAREPLLLLGVSMEEADTCLAKAFGWSHSPYWGEEKAKTVPECENVGKTLKFLRDLGLSNLDLSTLLKKFPEILGCSLEEELEKNVAILDKDWGITGNTLRSLLLRNPKVLGYNVDCKGDCMAQCTRCWVRF